jgi:hypothetical protein
VSNEEIIHEILREGLEDWIPVDRLIDLTRQSSINSGEDYKETTLDVIFELLERGLARIGELGAPGFEEFEGNASTGKEFARVDLEKYDWIPQGASFWICNTAAGDALAQSK